MGPVASLSEPAVLVEKTTTAPKFEWVNALRGLAIAGVVLCHTYYLAVAGSGEILVPWPTLHPLLQTIAGMGARGVQLFFVASAFTLFLSLNSGHKQERNPLLNFFLRRFFRIAPLYYLALLFYSVWHQVISGTGPTFGAVVSNLFFVHGVRPEWINSAVPGGWSITAEMIFYLMVPWLAKRIKTVNGALWFILLTLAFNTVVQHALARVQPVGMGKLWQDFTFYVLPNQLPVFGLGILLYFVWRGGPASVFRPGPLLVAAGTILLSAVTQPNWPSGLPSVPNHVLLAAGFVVLALSLSRYEHPLLVNPVTTFIGKISFSLYVVHFGVLYAAQHLGWINVVEPTNGRLAILNLGLRFLLVLGASSALAWCTYRWIEVPFINVGKKLIARLESQS
jgi:peptidoglycan/LPS O-acetylase OafA/YrhL